MTSLDLEACVEVTLVFTVLRHVWTVQETEQALTLDKLLVIDRQIRVEGAKAALDSKGQSGGVQYAALQLQQIQQLRKAQSEQHSLAAQVASMRVQAKQNPAAFVPGITSVPSLLNPVPHRGKLTQIEANFPVL